MRFMLAHQGDNLAYIGRIPTYGKLGHIVAQRLFLLNVHKQSTLFIGERRLRSAPDMPAKVYNTPEAKLRQAIFKMVQMHLKYHLRTIRQTFTPKGNGSPGNRYYSLNSKGLTAALTPLAELYCAGQDVTINDVEQAISDYAAAHPTSIRIASRSGYSEVYLTGPWPDTITLNALAGDSTVIIIVNEYGQQTTINSDGTVSTNQNTGDNSNGSNGDNGSNGSSQNQNENQNGGSSSGSDGNNGGNDSGNGDEN